MHLPSVNTTLACVVVSDEAVHCTNVSFELAAKEQPLTPSERLFWIYLFIYLILVLVAGLMSGLTLAILSLDVTGLKVLVLAGAQKHKKYAKRILPFARRHHLVLIVLVLANSLAVEAMPLFLDRISDPIVAITVSTTAVLIFGEVLPQAVCSRYGLAIGYYFSWLVWALIGLFFIIGYPLSLLLDFLLGKGHGTFYRRAELQALVDIHGPPPTDVVSSPERHVSRATSDADECLTLDEVLIMKGALCLAAKQAVHAVTPLDEVFMLPSTAILDKNTLQKVLDIGHSRVPVYDGGDRSNILGVLMVKKLILLDPAEGKPLRQAIEENWNGCFRKPVSIPENKPMYELLNEFQVGYTHIAFTTRPNQETGKEEITGIVTLEGILEQILQEQIYDESDTTRQLNSRIQMARAAAERQLSHALDDTLSSKDVSQPLHKDGAA